MLRSDGVVLGSGGSLVHGSGGSAVLGGDVELGGDVSNIGSGVTLLTWLQGEPCVNLGPGRTH